MTNHAPEYYEFFTFIEPESVQLTIEASESSDWFSLSRVGHDGRVWLERVETGKFPMHVCTSQRLHRRTCVEGPSYEWEEMANCLERGLDLEKNRCGIVHWNGAVGLYSPRNSNDLVPLITKESALELVDRIREVIDAFKAAKNKQP